MDSKSSKRVSQNGSCRIFAMSVRDVVCDKNTRNSKSSTSSASNESSPEKPDQESPEKPDQESPEKPDQESPDSLTSFSRSQISVKSNADTYRSSTEQSEPLTPLKTSHSLKKTPTPGHELSLTSKRNSRRKLLDNKPNDKMDERKSQSREDTSACKSDVTNGITKPHYSCNEITSPLKPNFISSVGDSKDKTKKQIKKTTIKPRDKSSYGPTKTYSRRPITTQTNNPDTANSSREDWSCDLLEVEEKINIEIIGKFGLCSVSESQEKPACNESVVGNVVQSNENNMLSDNELSQNSLFLNSVQMNDLSLEDISKDLKIVAHANEMSKQIVNCQISVQQNVIESSSIKLCISNTDNISVKDDSNFNENKINASNPNEIQLVSLQEPGEIPRMRPIFARGGIRPPTSTRGFASTSDKQRSTVLDEENLNIIKPNPLMSFELDGDMSKLIDNESDKEAEVFDSVQSTVNPRETQDCQKKCSSGHNEVTGNVDPEFSQDIRRKPKCLLSNDLNPQTNASTIKLPPKPPALLLPPKPPALFHSQKASKESKHVLTRPDTAIDEEFKKLDNYLGIKTNNSHNKNEKEQREVNPQTKKQQIRSEKTYRNEDWTSELLEINNVDKTGTQNNNHNKFDRSSTSDLGTEHSQFTKPLMDTTSLWDNDNTNQRNKTSPNRSHRGGFQMKRDSVSNDLILVPMEPSDSLKQSICKSSSECGILNQSKSLESTANGQYSVKSNKAISESSPITTSSDVNNNGEGRNIDDYSDYSSVCSEEYKPKEMFKKPQDVSESSGLLSKQSKHNRRYSSQEISTTDTISMSSGVHGTPRKISNQTSPRSEQGSVSDNNGFHPMYPFGTPNPMDPMFNQFMKTNWMQFYPFNMYPPVPPFYPNPYPHEYTNQFYQVPENKQNSVPKEPKYSETTDPVENLQSIKQEKNLKKAESDNLKSSKLSDSEKCHLITVPLSMIHDNIEQAQRLLKYVEGIIKKMPNATGLYYQGTLELGVTTLKNNDYNLTCESEQKFSSDMPYNDCKEMFHKDRTMDTSPTKYHFQQRCTSPSQFNSQARPQSHLVPGDHLRQYTNNRKDKFGLPVDSHNKGHSQSTSSYDYDTSDDESANHGVGYDANYQNNRKAKFPYSEKQNIYYNYPGNEDNKMKFVHNPYDEDFPELGKNFKSTKRFSESGDIKELVLSENDNAQVINNSKYIPPHKRRLSEYTETQNAPLTKFSELNTFNAVVHPYENWQKYMKSSKPKHYERNFIGNQSEVPPPTYYSSPQNFPAPRRYSDYPYPEDHSIRNISCDRMAETRNVYPVYDRQISEDRRLSDRNCSRHIDDIWISKLKQRSESYKFGIIDSHCHLDLLYRRLSFEGSYKEFLEKYNHNYPCNFEGCISIFCDPRNFHPSGLWKELAGEENVWIAIGCHPKYADKFDKYAENNLRRNLTHPKVVALGEIGLDYSKDNYHSSDIQKDVFIRQLQLCREDDLNKPLVIHCRDAEEDCLEIMEKFIPRNYMIQCHCFSGNYSQAQRWLSTFPNLYLGLTNVVTFSSARSAHEVARLIPLNRLLLETDAPYFVPCPLQKERQVNSFPGFVLSVAEEIAHHRNIEVDKVLRHCLSNTKKLFGI